MRWSLAASASSSPPCSAACSANASGASSTSGWQRRWRSPPSPPPRCRGATRCRRSASRCAPTAWARACSVQVRRGNTRGILIARWEPPAGKTRKNNRAASHVRESFTKIQHRSSKLYKIFSDVLFLGNHRAKCSPCDMRAFQFVRQ